MPPDSAEEILGNTRAVKKKSVFEEFHITESYVSLILGIVVVIVSLFILLTFTKSNQTQEVSSVKTEELPTTLESKEPKPEAKKEGEQRNEQNKYTIKEGDTLWDISEQKLGSGFIWKEIAKANNITNPENITPGIVITIQKIEQKNIPQSSVAVSDNSAVTGTNKITDSSYTVVKDDTLWDIAVRAYGDGFRWQEIATANNLSDPDLIFPGNVFRLPR